MSSPMYIKFCWNGGGENVCLCGSFSNWKQMSMKKSAMTGSFEKAVQLESGTYEYKFVVDGQWTHDQDKPTLSDNCGGFNNVITVATLSTGTGAYTVQDAYMGSEEDSDDDSDTESVCSMLSVTSSTTEQEVGGPSAKLYVQHPPFVKKEQLREHFKKNGFADNVKNIHPFFDKATRKAKGYSVVSLTPAELAEEAVLKLNSSLLFGKHKLIVTPFKTKQKRERKRQKKSSQKTLEQPVSSAMSRDQQPAKVHVAKFPPYVNDEHLRDHFKDYKAKIIDTFVVKDKQTHQSKGFGFVKFSSHATAEHAVKHLNGSKLNGKHKINVSFAKEYPFTKDQPNPQGKRASLGLSEVGGSTSIVQEPSPYYQQSSQTGTQVELTCVAIKNIDPEVINEAEIKAMISMPIVSFMPNKNMREILIRCTSASDAAKAAEILSGKNLLGNIIQAFVYQDASTPMASSSHTQQGGFNQRPSYPPPRQFGPPSTVPGPVPPQGVLSHTSHPSVRPGPPLHMNPPSQPPPMMPPAPFNQARGPTGQWVPPHQVEPPRGPGQMYTPHPNKVLLPSPFDPPPPYSVQPAPVTQPNMAAGSFSVKVTHLSPTVNKEILHQHFSQAGELSDMPKISESKNRYARVNYKYLHGAENAVKMFNGTPLCGWKINVSQQKSQKTPTSPPPAISPPGDEACLPTKQSRSKGKSQLVKTMKLQPDQWNRLTSIDPHGGSKFQEIKAPFESNPNVSIQLQIETTSVRFTGTKDAVSSAYAHFEGHLDKELHIADRMKMEALVQLYPNLPAQISQKHGVTISGYTPDSHTVRFEGHAASIGAARRELESIVCQWSFKQATVHLLPPLLSSVKKRFQNEGILAHLALQPQTSQLVVCSFAQQEQDRAFAVLEKGLSSKYVKTPSEAFAAQLAGASNISFRKLEEEYSVTILTDSEQIMVYGFVPSDVNAVQKKLFGLSKQLSVKEVPIELSTGQAAYINMLQADPKREGKLKVPAKLITKDDKFVLSGSPEAIQNSQEIIQSALSEIHCQLFLYSCHFKFLSQIKSSVLHPLKHKKIDCNWHCSEEPSAGKGGQKKKPESGGKFSVLVFSKDPIAFGEVRKVMEAINPGSQKFTLPRRGALDIVKKMKSELETKYYVRINEHEQFLIIHGLIPNEIQQCWEEIHDRVTSTLVVVKHIPINSHQMKYLKRKRSEEIEKMKKECEKLEFWSGHRGESDSPKVFVKGTMKQVESVEETISTMIESGLEVDEFDVTCEGKLFGMWIKWWKKDKKKQEAQYDLLIDFSKLSSEASATSSADRFTDAVVHFEVCGTDISEIQDVKEAICQMETAERVLEVSKESGTAILNALRQKKLEFLQQLPVQVEVEKPSLSKVTVTSPLDATVDLDSAVEGIEEFIGANTNVHEEITSGDPIVGLILSSRRYSAQYLSKANSIAKFHHVSVHPLRKPQFGLRLTGNQSAICAVESLIRTSVLLPIEQSISQLPPIKVKQSLLTTREFSKLETKLQDDLCVTCSYPKVGKQSNAIRSIIIQPSSTARSVSFEICSGNIVFESVDAIVNAANEDLKHIGGLAKAISDAGGSAIQDESNRYIQTNRKKLKPGEAVCLGAGKLPCKKVIHAVGPRWSGGTGMEEQTLYFTIYNCLHAADKEELGSIAFPAISTGVFGVPEDVCAKASMKAIRDFCQSKPDSSIHTVRFVLFTSRAVDSFVSVFDTGFFSGHEIKMSAAPKPTKCASNTWSWCDDNGTFTAYKSNVSQALTQAYSKDSNASVTLSINGQIYLLNFSAMTQTNVASRHTRKIRCQDKHTSTSASVQWLWKGDRGVMEPYAATESQAIESMYAAGRVTQPLVIQGKMYTFDFTSMCQINSSTGYKRKIARQPIDQSVNPLDSEKEHNQTTPLSDQAEEETSPQEEVEVVLRGPNDVLPQAKKELEERMKSLFKMKDISIPSSLTDAYKQKLMQVAKKHGVSCNFKKGKSKEFFHLEGLSSSVQSATSSIQTAIIDYQLTLSDSKELESAPPPEWQQQSQTTQLFPVSQGSAEWTQVEQKFKATMSSSRISQISRIQNTWLWDKYVSQKKRLNLKNGGNVNEKELFHGTRGNDPKLIYEGEDGFDMRYSNSGMWGQANYFAVNASYSNSYAHPTQDGHREMFLAKVLTGDSYNCSSNSSLRMPPFKSTSASSSAVSKVYFEKMRYDTVTGQTGGSQVFMTYDNDKAYPAYLIKYNYN